MELRLLHPCDAASSRTSRKLHRAKPTTATTRTTTTTIIEAARCPAAPLHTTSKTTVQILFHCRPYSPVTKRLLVRKKTVLNTCNKQYNTNMATSTTTPATSLLLRLIWAWLVLVVGKEDRVAVLFGVLAFEAKGGGRPYYYWGSSSSRRLPCGTATTTTTAAFRTPKPPFQPFARLFLTNNNNNNNDDNESSRIFYNDFDDFEPNTNNSPRQDKSAAPLDEPDDEDELDDDEDDDNVTATTRDLDDWRIFRRNLLRSNNNEAAAAEEGIIQQPAPASSLLELTQTFNNNYANVKNTTATAATTTTTTTLTEDGTNNNNVQLLESQNSALALEYQRDGWAHATATPEVGGLVIRMPLEVELRRNYKHSLMGQKLREILQKRVDKEESKKKLIEQRDDKTNDTFNRTQSSKSKNTINPRQNASSVSASSSSVPCVDRMEMAIWYAMAQNLVEAEMNVIAGAAGADNELDSTTLNDLSSEVLALFLDHQETWQEVCLVLEHNAQSSTTLVLNRPMALQLTDALGRMVLHGTFATEKGPSLSKTIQKKKKLPSMKDFLKAFGKECGVYLGGLDDQHLPAILIHGIADLPGATEIAIGTGVYRGGVEAAVAGVLAGKYKPLEFRFFVGRHSYSTADKTDDDEGLVDDGGMRLENFGKELKDLIGGADDEDEYEEEEQEFNIPTSLELEVVLGKYQPIACARSLVLKQCIQLPKPLWHEVLELCGGELKDISELEQLKPVDTQFQIVDDDDDDEDDDEFDFIAFDTGDEDDEDDDDDDEEEFYKI